MAEKPSDFIFLTTYHPWWWSQEEQKSDLERIKQIGFDGTRTEVGYELKRHRELGLIKLGEVPVFQEKVDEADLMRKANGELGEAYYNWRRVCPSSERVLRICEQAIRRQIRKYRGEETIVAFQFDNETSYAVKGGASEYLCYCSSCVQGFREFLKQRFGTLARLNQLWGTEYASWEEITLPVKEERRPDRDVGLLPLWVAVRRFANRTVANYISKLAQAAREETDKPLAIAEMNIMFYDNCVLTGQDLYQMSREVDILGLNIGGCDFAEIIDLCRGFGRKIWLTESHIETMILNARLMRQRYYSSIAHGCRGINFFQFRADARYVERDMFGIHREDGKPVQLLYEVVQIVKELKSLAPKLRDTTFYQPKVAIVYSWETMFVADYLERTIGDRGMEMSPISALKGACRVLRALHIPTEAVTTDQIREQNLDRYEALLLPACIAFPDDVGRKLMEWVKRGGTLIVDYPFMRYDEDGILNQDEPGGAFAELGLCTNRVSEGLFYVNAGHSFPLLGERARVVSHRGEVLGRFEDGEPAVIRTDLGEGKVIFFAASPNIGFKNYPCSHYSDFIRGFLPEGPVKLELPSAIAVEIDVGLQQSQKGAFLILVNYNQREVGKIPICVEVEAVKGSQIWLHGENLESKQRLSSCSTVRDGKVYFQFILPKLETSRVVEFA